MDEIGLGKTFKDLYTATPKVKEVVAGTATFLAMDGQGAPGGEAFQAAIQCLYNAVYTLKFSLKHEGKLDFKVSRLEGLYLSDPKRTPKPEWTWRLLIRIPDEVTAASLKATQKAILEKKGVDTSAVGRIRWNEGRALQILHVGPYDQAAAGYEKLDAFAQEHGLELTCPAHEIYLSDPRRVAPEKLRTILRLSIVKT